MDRDEQRIESIAGDADVDRTARDVLAGRGLAEAAADVLQGPRRGICGYQPRPGLDGGELILIPGRPARGGVKLKKERALPIRIFARVREPLPRGETKKP